MGSKVIEALEIVLPLVKDIVGKDMQLSLCDRTRVIQVWPGEKVHLANAVPGVDLDWQNPSQRNMLEAMEKGKADISYLPKEMFGFPVKGILTPIFENGEVVGIVACAFSIEQGSNVQEAVCELEDNLIHSKENVENIAMEAAKLADKLNHIQEVSVQAKNEADKATNLVKTVQANASKSNILALNASIEAARAGEAGRGFNVVAGEMGKLAQVSGSSAKEISQSLTGIVDAIEKVSKAVMEANDIAGVQATATTTVTKTLADITSSVNEVVAYTRNIEG